MGRDTYSMATEAAGAHAAPGEARPSARDTEMSATEAAEQHEGYQRTGEDSVSHARGRGSAEGACDPWSS